jgi:hypothetical protein
MKWREGQQFENPPAGSHVARCYGVIDLGTQQHSYNNETWASRDVRLSFELPTELMSGCYNPDVKGKPFSVHITLKQSLHSKAKMRGLLEGWRGKKFDKESADKFDPAKLVGATCRITLVENGDYVNIASISPLSKIGGKPEVCPKQVNPSVFFSLEPDEFSEKTFQALGEKTREKIGKSPEFMVLTDPSGGRTEPTDDTGDVETADAGGEDVPW